MRAASVLAIGLLAAALGGCVHSTTEMLSPVRYPPTTPDSVTVYVSVADVEAQHLTYDRVAMLFISADASLTNENAIVKRAREDAAKVGANGVILGDTREPGYLSSKRQARVLAIRTHPKPAP